MYPEAAKTGIIIAQDQQNKGFYRTAHDLLFGECFIICYYFFSLSSSKL